MLRRGRPFSFVWFYLAERNRERGPPAAGAWCSLPLNFLGVCIRFSNFSFSSALCSNLGILDSRTSTKDSSLQTPAGVASEDGILFCVSFLLLLYSWTLGRVLVYAAKCFRN
jgi:hypothetical protein